MGTVPTPHTWLDGEEPDYKDLATYLEKPVTFMMNPPMVRLRRVTTQNISNNTTTAISWDFVEVETENMWDASQPTRIKPSTPGWYIGQCGMAFAASNTGQRELNVRKNNSTTSMRVNHKAYDFGSIYTVGNRGNVFLEQFNGTTDYIEMTVFQNSGGTLAVLADTIERQCDMVLRWFAAL
jgi:hypothetical protein